MSELQTTPTRHVKAANGVTFAYRRLGSTRGIPLLLHIHFRANMDFWDPLFINSIAATRPVIIFDQAGVGRSTGVVPRTFQGWANDLIAFVSALNIDLIDLFGFSLGGVAVQVVALTRPRLVRRLILAGTTASQPHTPVSGAVWPRDLPPPEPIRQLMTAASVEEGKSAITYSFFPDNDSGRQAANRYWGRLKERHIEPLNLVLLDKDNGGRNQRLASSHKEKSEHSWFHRLGDLKMPVLIANGDNDVLIPTSRSWELFARVEHAQLIIYPGAGHGFLWQYAEDFAHDINRFLDRGLERTDKPSL